MFVIYIIIIFDAPLRTTNVVSHYLNRMTCKLHGMIKVSKELHIVLTFFHARNVQFILLYSILFWKRCVLIICYIICTYNWHENSFQSKSYFCTTQRNNWGFLLKKKTPRKSISDLRQILHEIHDPPLTLSAVVTLENPSAIFTLRV